MEIESLLSLLSDHEMDSKSKDNNVNQIDYKE